MNKSFWIENLSCPDCARQMEGAVRRQKGVDAARVSFSTGRLRVDYRPEAVDEDRIREIIRSFGLEVGRVD